MPVKVSKKVIMKLDSKKINSVLPSLRSKYLLPIDDNLHQELVRYLKTINKEYSTPEEDLYNTFEFIHTNNIKKYPIIKNDYQVLENQSNSLDESCPEALKKWINFVTVQCSIDMTDIRSVETQIHLPAKNPSSYVNSIKRMSVKNGFRVVVFLCSHERLTYKISNIEDYQKIVGGPKTENDIPEYVRTGNYYFFEQMTGMTVNILFNDEERYVVTGERDRVERKRPTSRYVVCLDFNYKTDKIKEKINETMDSLRPTRVKETKTQKIMSKIQEKHSQQLEELIKSEQPECLTEENDSKPSGEESDSKPSREENEYEDDIF